MRQNKAYWRQLLAPYQKVEIWNICWASSVLRPKRSMYIKGGFFPSKDFNSLTS